MSPRAVELALKKQRLQLRSAMLRTEFSAGAKRWAPAFALADRGRAALRWLQRHPVVPVAVLAAVAAARPRAILRWAQRGFIAWQGLRKLHSVIQLPRDR